jgi:hypothetical protein
MSPPSLRLKNKPSKKLECSMDLFVTFFYVVLGLFFDLEVGGDVFPGMLVGSQWTTWFLFFGFCILFFIFLYIIIYIYFILYI